MSDVRQTDRRHTKASLNAPPIRGRHNKEQSRGSRGRRTIGPDVVSAGVGELTFRLGVFSPAIVSS